MSDAKLKCSNCGAELTNFTFGWGKKQWLWSLVSFVPLIALIIWMQLWMFRSNRDFLSEIEISLVETQAAHERLDILGQLKNIGDNTWDRVTVEAEVYDKDGKFLNEVSDYLSVTLSPGSEEYFRISLPYPDARVLENDSKVVLKVTDADEDRF